MSQYTTDEVLRMMEEWYEQHKDDEGFDPGMPLKGFDGLLDADLSNIDLSESTVKQKAEAWKQQNPGKLGPPWSSWISGGIDLRAARLSTGQHPCINFFRAGLQGAAFVDAELERANFFGAQLLGASFNGAQLQEASFDHAQLQGVDFGGGRLQGASFAFAQLQEASFFRSQLHGASFTFAQLQRASFLDARLQGAYLATELAEAFLEDASWDGDYVLGYDLNCNFRRAEPVYRRLKQYYNGTGQYDLAGEFHRRELLMRRKRLWDIQGVRLAPSAPKWVSRRSALIRTFMAWLVSRLLAPVRALITWVDAQATSLSRYLKS